MPAADALERAWREHWARLLALLIGQFARPDLAEDALADAFASAAKTWDDDGVPGNPPAWLLTTARRRVLDQLRAEAMRRRRAPMMVVDAELRATAAAVTDPGAVLTELGAHIGDETLRLIFTCCHPALAPEARVALTLRFVLGLDTEDIARLLLVQPATMAARITRAKKRLAASGIPFAVPDPAHLDERTDVVVIVLYLVFTAGYQLSAGPTPLRVDTAAEAIRLARELDRQLPGQPAVRALLAVMLLQHSRRNARVDPDGTLVLLPDQDRSRWDAAAIAEGLAVLDTVPPGDGLAEQYRLQGLIAAEHARADAAAGTRWDAIAAHYAALDALTGSPVVRLARAVALAEAEGPQAGLALTAGLAEVLPHSHRVPAVRGELFARAGENAQAAAELRRALDLVDNDVERRHLERRLTDLE